MTENAPIEQIAVPLGWIAIGAVVAVLLSYILLRALIAAAKRAAKSLHGRMCMNCYGKETELLQIGPDWRQYVCHECQEIFVVDDKKFKR